MTAQLLVNSPVDLEAFANGPPHALFDELRREDPVHKHAEPNPFDGKNLWSLTRHADLRAVSMDTANFSSHNGPFYPQFALPEHRRHNQVLFNSGERHARLRGLVASAFSPRVIARFGEWIRDICVRIIEEAMAAGRFEGISVIAAELPAQVIASILGIPEKDRHLIRGWADVLFARMDPAVGPAKAMQVRDELEAYALRMRDFKAKKPAADMSTELLAMPADGIPITPEEYAESFFLLVTAGFETTHSLIAQTLLVMSTRDDVRDAIASAPQERLRATVEESLRYNSPVMHMGRTATNDVEVGGRLISKGDFVIMWYSAANRDPAVFENPHDFDIDRPRRGQVAFGAGGPHFCLGAHLARLEVEILLEEMNARGLRVASDGEPTRLPSVSINALKTLPLRAI